MDNENLLVEYTLGSETIYLTPEIVNKYILRGSSTCGVSDQEFNHFAEIAKSKRLNPFTGEIYIIKFENRKAKIIVGKEAIIKQATSNQNFDGLESGIFVQNSKGETITREGGLICKNETLIGSWAKLYRKDWSKPLYYSFSIEEIQNKKNPMWFSMPCTMAIKTAILRVCRDAFIENLYGFYDSEEGEEEIYFNNSPRENNQDTQLLKQASSEECYVAAEDYEDNKYHHVYEDLYFPVIHYEDEYYNPFSDI